MDVDGLRCRACAVRRLRAQVEAAEVVASTLEARRRLAVWLGIWAGVLVGAVVAFILPYRYPAEYTGTLPTPALPLALLVGYTIWAGTLVMSIWARVWRRAFPEGTMIIATFKGWADLINLAFPLACIVGALGGWVRARRALLEAQYEYEAKSAQAARTLADLRRRPFIEAQVWP
jgi:hypothetical protein